MVSLNLFILWRSISIQNCMFPRWLVQVLHPSQKFERPPFWNGWRYGIKEYGVEVTFNGMTSLLNFIKIYQLVQKLLWGHTDRRTDRQTGDLISLTFLFKESRLKMQSYWLLKQVGHRVSKWWVTEVFLYVWVTENRQIPVVGVASISIDKGNENILSVFLLLWSRTICH
jgi:hypothetical protein